MDVYNLENSDLVFLSFLNLVQNSLLPLSASYTLEILFFPLKHFLLCFCFYASMLAQDQIKMHKFSHHLYYFSIYHDYTLFLKISFQSKWISIANFFLFSPLSKISTLLLFTFPFNLSICKYENHYIITKYSLQFWG